MKLKIMLIGIALVLALCISPVAAVSADDFEIDTWQEGTWKINSYMYTNTSYPDEEYIPITGLGTRRHSKITFQAANIDGAPVMEVDTYYMAHIYLPRSVGEWEIKFYSAGEPAFFPDLDDKYLKNAGVVNLNGVFGKYIVDNGLYLDLIYHQCMWPWGYSDLCYYIPSV